MTAPFDQEPHGPAAIAAQTAVALLRAKMRLIVGCMALALLTFIFLVTGEGRPAWLVGLIGFFGVILIGLFIALVAFWLHVFKNVAPGKKTDARD